MVARHPLVEPLILVTIGADRAYGRCRRHGEKQRRRGRATFARDFFDRNSSKRDQNPSEHRQLARATVLAPYVIPLVARIIVEFKLEGAKSK